MSSYILPINESKIKLFKTKDNNILIKYEDFVTLCKQMTIDIDFVDGTRGTIPLNIENEVTGKQVLFSRDPRNNFWPAGLPWAHGTIKLLMTGHTSNGEKYNLLVTT